jgi:hypothetical protein
VLMRQQGTSILSTQMTVCEASGEVPEFNSSHGRGSTPQLEAAHVPPTGTAAILPPNGGTEEQHAHTSTFRRGHGMPWGAAGVRSQGGFGQP